MTDPILIEVTEAPVQITVASTGQVLSVATGTVGPAGAAGAAGANGQGVPTGGTTGQVLAKKSSASYDTEWVAQTGGGGGGSGTVTNVTGTAPIVVANGTTTPAVSISAATTSAAGSMSAADKSKLDGLATVATSGAHGDLTGLTTGDPHTQYQRSEATFTSTSPFTITDESAVITSGSAVTLGDAATMGGRTVAVGAAAQTVTISPAGTDTMWDDPGNSYSLPSGNGITFVSVQIGGGWGWAILTRNGPAFDMPKWAGESLAEGKVLRVNSSGAPAWANLAAGDVPNLAASKVTSGTFDVARIPSHASTHGSAGSDPVTVAQSQVTNLTTDLAAKVPTSRTVNGKALSSNVTLTASDVGAPVGNNDLGRVSGACYLTGSGAYFGGLGASTGNTMSTPDAAALDITGDIEMVARINFADYTTGAAQYIVGKWGATTDASYYFYVGSTGNLSMVWFEGATQRNAVPGINPALFVDGTTYWVKGTMAVNVGGQYEVKFYYAADSSTEPSSWTQWGTTVTGTTGISSIRTGNGVLSIGSLASISTAPVGTIYRAIVRSGIGGTTVFDANFATQTADALAFTSGPGSGAYLDGSTGLVVQGVAGNFAATPDTAALSITGDVDLSARVKLASWATNTTIFGNLNFGSSGYELHTRDLSSGAKRLTFTCRLSGSDVSATSTVDHGIADGAFGWVRATRNATTGTVTFYTAPDSSSEPSSWTQLGATVATTTGNMVDATLQMKFGERNSGQTMNGTIAQAIARNVIGGTGAAVVLNANFAAQAANASTFQEANGATVTVTNPYAVPVTITTTRYSYGVPSVQFSSTGTQALTANTVYYQPFEVTAPITLDAMAFEVTTGPASTAAVRLGVYAADANLQPTGAALFDSGDVSVATSSTGVNLKQATPATLQPGVYLTAINTSQGLTARTAVGGQTFIGTAIGTNPFTVLASATQTQGAWPNPGTAWSTRAASTAGIRHMTFLRWRSA